MSEPKKKTRNTSVKNNGNDQDKKANQMKMVNITWMDALDNAEIQEAMDEACVDAYDEHEQCDGLTTMAMEELAFPFPAKVLGEPVTVVDAVAAQDDTFGLDLVVEYEKNRYAIAAGSVQLLEPLPDGHLVLAAYLLWRGSL